MKRFFSAEEVPRWFGLSLVLLYLCSLGAVGHLGIREVRREATAHFEWSGRYAFGALGDRLCLADGDALTGPPVLAAMQRELHDFAAHIPAKSLRVVDRRRRVIASTDPMEVGTIVNDAGIGAAVPTFLEVTLLPVAEQDLPDRLLRAPLASCDRGKPPGSSATAVQPGAADLDDGDPLAEGRGNPGLYLEAILPGGLHGNSKLVDHAETLTVVLVALGALFGLYRCLRAQLRGVSRIAGRLQSHRHRIEENLASLRVADAFDGVTGAWNELIDLAQGLADTVQRNDADEELTQALERSGGGALAEALNAVPDGIIFITDEVRFEYVNSTACHLLGWTPQEAKSAVLSEARGENIGGRVLESLRECQRPDGSFEPRTLVVDAGAGKVDECSSYRMWVIPLNREHYTGECVVIVRDVSQQIQAEKAREDFVTQVTHELRTPLTNIRAYAETLSSGMFDDPKVITECYNVITKETRRLSRLIEDILSVSQLEVGSIELQLDNVDLKTLLGDGIRDVRGLADEKDIDLQLVLPAKLEPISADRDKLAVVINNLLGNAIKYTPQHGNVILGCQIAGSEIALTFKDNGIGIDSTDHGRVFEKFQRGEDPEVQEETGTGIGLFTAREIVRRHGGDIELISNKGEGSTFTVRLPHRESRATALTTAEEV